MKDLGTYNRLDRTPRQIILIALDECNTKITDGYISLYKFNDGLQSCYSVRHYKKLEHIPKKPQSTYFDVSEILEFNPNKES
jgi:hypothetical protein